MQSFFYALAFSIGLVIPAQAAINNQLKAVIGGSTLLAALVSFSSGAIVLFLVALCTGQKWGSFASGLPRADWWMLTGGTMGAFFVFGTTFLAPRIGVAAMLSLIIAGQVLVSMLFDRFGWLGMPLREVGNARLVGAVLVAVGVALVNLGDKFWR
ncbi:DMT family transporter [Andreprevotia chitinilytica]|uniref:DMT family transporter n=1 Tax=Andreprevotia chitinilytica TaxID=396808 RepID=UPI000558712B|nr:DMT family transporter [Andreprevotia chitinilytica]